MEPSKMNKAETYRRRLPLEITKLRQELTKAEARASAAEAVLADIKQSWGDPDLIKWLKTRKEARRD